MASLPARPQPQRRSSPEQSANDRSRTPAQATPVRTRSAHSEDSQTLFLNSPKHEGAQQQNAGQRAPQSNQTGDAQEEEVKKCWICFAESTEDTPETSPWRDPCPCALVAHEECLLDWIADTEAPNNRNRARSLHAPKIECPQCKSEIKLARPRDVVVEAVQGLDRLTSQLITPGAATLLLGAVYRESLAFGVHSIYAIFGAEDGLRILQPLLQNITRMPVELNVGDRKEVARVIWRIFLDHLEHWRLYVGIPMIGPLLVLSRTTLADSLLPTLPIVFFATPMHLSGDVYELGAWPPSASFAYAVLPYIRQAYNAGYKRLFAEKEKQWMREIQPRVNQGPNDDGQGGAAPAEPPPEDRGDGNLFEVRIDGGIWEEWEDEADIPQDRPAGQNAPQPVPPPPAQQDGQADPPPNIADNRANEARQNAGPAQARPQANAVPDNNNAAGERRLSFSPTAVAHSVLGALAFPSIAGMAGELLKLALPRAWTRAPTSGFLGLRQPARGLLQAKWGRSLVGGCLFVLVKDAVVLYVKWKMARMHRARRVVDYSGSKRRVG